jgi:His-Xaa-Ser repeat protein HxsA
MKFIKKVASFVAAGMAVSSVNSSADAAEQNVVKSDDNSLTDWVKDLVAENKSKQAYTLAYHQSHQSHASHASHQSHRSYHHPIDVPNDNLTSQNIGESIGIEGRNMSSTPANSILPSSVAITKKVKILPGNSGKFKDIVSKAQIALAARGFDVGALDGELHARTVSAIHSFQKSSGMAPSGKLDPETLSRLGVVAS